MPRVNIWLPAPLHEAVKRAGVPISEVCQQALSRELNVPGSMLKPRPADDDRNGPYIRRQ